MKFLDQLSSVSRAGTGVVSVAAAPVRVVRRRRGIDPTGRVDGAAGWMVRVAALGDESRLGRGRDVDMPVETSRGDAAAATWKFRGD